MARDFSNMRCELIDRREWNKWWGVWKIYPAFILQNKSNPNYTILEITRIIISLMIISECFLDLLNIIFKVFSLLVSNCSQFIFRIIKQSSTLNCMGLFMSISITVIFDLIYFYGKVLTIWLAVLKFVPMFERFCL